MPSELLPRDLPQWRDELKAICAETNRLEKLAYEIPFGELRQDYERPDGLRQRAQTILRKLAAVPGNPDLDAACHKAKSLLKSPLTEEAKYLAWANIRRHLLDVLNALPGSRN